MNDTYYLKIRIKVSQMLQGMKMQWRYLKAGSETTEHLIFLGRKTKLYLKGIIKL